MRVQRYTSVVDHLAAAIRSGALPPGTRLPTHRCLAREHGIAQATATKVYRALVAAGLVVGEPGRGTFVRDLSGFAGLEPRRLPHRQPGVDLSFNQPLAATQGDQLRTALRELAAESDLAALLRQQPPGGRSRDRAAIATYLLGRQIDVAPDAVLLTAGAQHGLDTTFGALGALVAADTLTYPGAKVSAATRRVELAPIRADFTGTDLDHLVWLCTRRPITAIDTIPSLHNPLGFTLDTEARQRITDIARRHDLTIIEDATYAFLEPEAPPALFTLAPERTVYVGSMSKNLAAGLRVGFLVVPPQLRPELSRVLRASSWGTSSVSAALTTRWLGDGTVGRLENLRRDDARERQALARDRLSGLDYRAHPGSYCGWLTLPEDSRSDLVTTADAFSLTPNAPNALRLALATPELADLEAALGRIRTVVTDHSARPPA
ncbi:MAG: PLP-dependent aminotransferase family protein [Mycobacterium sp.]